MSAASRIVSIAAGTLPKHLRDRYREQWLADVRDAPEAGLRPSDIALASLAFAATCARPLGSGRRELSPELIQRRSRLAIGLALSSALLALSTYASLQMFGGLTGNLAYDLASNWLTAALMLYAVVAPLTALALLATRGTTARVRLAVVILAAASCTSVAHRFIDSQFWSDGASIYLTAGTGAYLVGLVLVAAGCALVWRPVRGHSLLAPAIGATVVWLLLGLGVAVGIGAWNSRSPLPPGVPVGALDAEWVARERLFTQLAQSVFWAWAISCAVLGILVFLVGRRMSARKAIAVTIAAVALVFVSASGVMNFVALGMSFDGSDRAIQPLLLVGQALLVGVVLVAVGGVRYERTPAGREPELVGS